MGLTLHDLARYKQETSSKDNSELINDAFIGDSPEGRAFAAPDKRPTGHYN